MSILVDHQLRYIGPDVLSPFDESMVQPSSIDLRLGTSFRVSRHHALECIDLAAIPDENEITDLIEVPLFRSACSHCAGRGELLRAEPNNWVRCQACTYGSIYDRAGRFVIHPGQVVLGSTLERITVPSNLVMTLEGKSSLARLFLLPHVQAGYFDPGWDGVGTLEIVNLNDVAIVLRPGLKICQSRWFELADVPTNLYGSAAAGSHYQGAMAVDGSRYEG